MKKTDPLSLFIGAFVIVLAIFSAGQAYSQHRSEMRQQDCVQHVIHDLVDALQARSDTVTATNTATTRVITKVAAAQNAQEVRTALKTFTVEQARIQRDRKANPYPPYPLGKCDT